MNWNSTESDDGVDRRSVLAAGAAGLSLSLSGCIDTVRSVVTDDKDDQLSLSIVTVPRDDNRESVQIARHLESNLQAVGIDADLTIRSHSEFLEKVLIDHDYDLFVGRHPADYDPDFLYEALHSSFADESGWQNPFGYNVRAVDRLLEEQRQADPKDRKDALEPLLEEIAIETPFEPICRPTEYRVASDRFDGWDENHLATRRGYLGLEPDDGVERLEALVTDARPSRNVNPLSATGRERETVVDLLYDSLGTVVETDDGDIEIKEWLAKEWEWETPADDDVEKTTATVRLREGCTFHGVDENDEPVPVTAEDVKFTYQFIEDTVYPLNARPSPAPRYRGHASAVDSVETDAEDEHWLRITFDAGREVAERALTVPILPKHVWWAELDERITDIENVSAPQGQWGIVTSNSIAPIGSGPYQFESQSERDHLTLERFDDHFTFQDDADDDHLLEPTAEEIRFTVDPGSVSSINRVASGGADLTESMLEAFSLGEIPEDTDEIERYEDDSWTFYYLGFNWRKYPKYQFRQAIAQLIDKEWVVDEVFFEDHAEPLATPVTDEWIPESLEWDGGEHVTSFVGSDGEPNVELARDMFEEIGYQYDDNAGRLRHY
ncbi:ABC transporter substrate-binding protein [Natronorubrum sp. FCH18a]|uniref:ABC transporter substrate-binding protein n=1 Tax=Natronorubrum sp. FCH18a TaxID=3447018 RepID=UPI003F517A03